MLIITGHCDSVLPAVHPERRNMLLYDLRAHNIDRLRHNLGYYPWHSFFECNDIEELYNQFLNIVMHIVAQSIPVRNVRLGNKEPTFITPIIKLLLKRRNKLRRKGRIAEADELAEKA
jgi:hypothetical protein